MDWCNWNIKVQFGLFLIRKTYFSYSIAVFKNFMSIFLFNHGSKLIHRMRPYLSGKIKFVQSGNAVQEIICQVNWETLLGKFKAEKGRNQ